MKALNIKRVLLLLVLSVLITFSVAGCTSDKDINSPNDSLPSSNTGTETKAWQDAYEVFLKDFPTLAGFDTSTFSLKDLDNDGVPELIIVQKKEEGQKSVLSVYSFNGAVFLIGECDDPNSYAGAFRITNNPAFPGLFSLRWGGGMEQYGYVSIIEGRLVIEDVWYIDRSSNTPQYVEVSDNKELVNESTLVFSPYGAAGNLLETYPINADSIDKMMRVGFER